MNSSYDLHTSDFAPTVIRLMRGPVYDDALRDWSELKLYFNDVRAYLARIGLEVVINENEGYAYLTQPESENEERALPRILRRRPLSWEVTMLCVILRRKLEEFDSRDLDSRKLFVTREDLKTEMEMYLPEGNNRSSLLSKLDNYIKNVKDLGYIVQTGKEDPADPDRTRYEVKRIIKARISNDELEGILDQMKKAYGHTGDDIRE